MGRITSMQNEIGHLQGKLAKQNKAIAQINVRDKKIKDAVKDFLANDKDERGELKSGIPVLTTIVGLL